MSELLAPLVRRALLDFLDAEGGEHNHHVLAMTLNALGHRVSRQDVLHQLVWLSDAALIHTETVGHYQVARILSAGSDVASGVERIDGVHRHRSGE